MRTGDLTCVGHRLMFGVSMSYICLSALLLPTTSLLCTEVSLLCCGHLQLLFGHGHAISICTLVHVRLVCYLQSHEQYVRLGKLSVQELPLTWLWSWPPMICCPQSTRALLEASPQHSLPPLSVIPSTQSGELSTQ